MHDREAGMHPPFVLFAFSYICLLRPTTANIVVVVFALLLFVISFLLSCTFAKSYIAILSFFASFSHTPTFHDAENPLLYENAIIPA